VGDAAVLCGGGVAVAIARQMRGMIVEAAEDEWARWQRQRPTLSPDMRVAIYWENAHFAFPKLAALGRMLTVRAVTTPPLERAFSEAHAWTLTWERRSPRQWRTDLSSRRAGGPASGPCGSARRSSGLTDCAG
jgi:hypothetical protein